MDPDETASIGAVSSWSTLFVIEASLTFQQTSKADYFVAICALRVKNGNLEYKKMELGRLISFCL